jgi:hypothetical protein
MKFARIAAVAFSIAWASTARAQALSPHADREAPVAVAPLPSHGHGEEIVASVPSGPVQDAMSAALPPAPKTVVRTTRMFGTVTIDHAAHLSRRARCSACHGPGPVSKITFTPQLAHDRCRGCHVDMQRGPTDCRGCHVVPPPAPPAPTNVVAIPPATPGAAATTVAVATGSPSPAGTERSASGPGGTTGQTEVEAGTTSELVEGGTLPSFGRTANVGFTVLATNGSVGVGPWFEFQARSGRGVVSFAIGTQGGASAGRAQLLVAGGRSKSLGRLVTATVMAVGGVDALRSYSTLQGVLGARAGVEWTVPKAPLVSSVGFSWTLLKGVTNPSTVTGERPSDLSLTLNLTAGFDLRH